MKTFQQYLTENEEFVEVYHSTPTNNVVNIMKTGLHPRMVQHDGAARFTNPTTGKWTAAIWVTLEKQKQKYGGGGFTQLKLRVPKSWVVTYNATPDWWKNSPKMKDIKKIHSGILQAVPPEMIEVIS